MNYFSSLLALALFTTACNSHSNTCGSDPAAGVCFDGGPDAAPDGAAQCTGTLEMVQSRVPNAMAGLRCPDRWEDVATRSCGTSTFHSLRAGMCGDNLVYMGNCSLDYFACVYDPSTHALIGAAEQSDTNAYCNMTSFSIATDSVAAAALGCNGLTAIDTDADDASADATSNDGGGAEQ